jgi:hypothetical protein
MNDPVTDDPTPEELEQLARSVAMSGVLGDRDRPTVPDLGVMAVCVASTGRKSRCSTCSAVRDYCNRVDAYHREVAAWSRANPDDQSEHSTIGE